jgi:Rad3-related DNA helicase
MQDLHKEFDQFIYGKHPGLEFRPQQKEVILEILEAFFEDPEGIYLLDAPTGSGKSIIAMIVADFLIHNGKRGYILASDLILHQQYVNDFKKMQLWNWGNIKGVDNYSCAVNGERFSVGDCKSKGMSYDAAENLPCFKHCGYLTARKKAIRSPLALLTYPYGLIQRNYVDKKQAENGKQPPFPKRDFVVCDEAHKMLDIVQGHFSPIVSYDIHKKISKLLVDMFDIGLKVPRIDTVRLKELIDMIYAEEDNAVLLRLLKEVTNIIWGLLDKVGDVREAAGKEFGENSVPKDWLIVFNLVDWCKDVHCKLEDYCEIIDKTGLEKMVKNPNDTNIIFNCIDEYYLLNKHVFSQFGFKLLMTATMGKPADFMRNHGISNAKYFKMDSHFNWERSPIYFYPGRKMSARYLADNLEWATTTLVDILTRHPRHSGIIHTGSYELGQKLWNALPKEKRKRVLLYKGSEEKDIMLKKMRKKEGLVLMGPSLLEGLNLIDDQSRFQVFMKVPYPHLGDKFVAAKLAFSQKWYNWKTSVSVLQGTGRSVRSDDDWAITYLVDGCFADLFQSAGDQFPIEFRSRVQVVRK